MANNTSSVPECDQDFLLDMKRTSFANRVYYNIRRNVDRTLFQEQHDLVMK